MTQPIEQAKRTGSRLVPALIFWSIAVGFFGWVGVQYVRGKIEAARQENAERRAAALQNEEIRKEISKLTAANSAIDTWTSDLCRHSRGGELFTSDLQRVFIRTDGRPILVYGTLEDLKEEGGEYAAIVTSNLCRGAKLRLELVTNADAVKPIADHRTDRTPFFALAVRADSVEKRSAPSSESADTNGEFVIKGRCTNLLFTGTVGVVILFDQLLQQAQSE